MRSFRASTIAAATVVASLAALAAPAVAGGPVCTDPIPRELCGGRVFAEPLQSVHGLTYREMVAGFEQLAADHPDWITFEAFGEGSADDLGLYYVEVTNPDSPIAYEDRKIVLVNQSIHGNEPGGREGGTRYLEDLVTGRDPERTALLDRVRLIQTFINPDGWSAGDHDHVQTGGGAYLWARQNGDGPLSGASDLGLGTDLNRQAPWRGVSHPDVPVSAKESIAFEDFVRQLAAHGDIQASVDIHGEVTDAAAWVMLSSGQFDLKGAFNQRVHGEAIHEDIAASLEDSTARQIIEAVDGAIPPTVLTASSEFGSIARESTASGTGFQGDWIAQPEGGDSASISTIELYNFLGAPGANSLTARPEVMQYYRDIVRGILGGLIDEAAMEHDTFIDMGSARWVDDAPVVLDPIRQIPVSAGDFWHDLLPYVDGDLAAVAPDAVATGGIADTETVVVTTDGLLRDPAAVAALRAFVEGGGNVVLTDAALQLLPGLVDGIAEGDVSMRTDDGGKVSYDRTHPLTEGIREIAWMNTETATMGYQVSSDTGSSAGNVPTWLVDRDVWEAAGGTTAGVSGGGTSVGEIAVGAGTVRTIGVLLPAPSLELEERITYGINGYGVLDTGYQVLANAMNADLFSVSSPVFPEVAPVGTMTVANLDAAPAADEGAPVSVLLALLAGLGLVARVARREHTNAA